MLTTEIKENQENNGSFFPDPIELEQNSPYFLVPSIPVV